jgi:hypothetical protein
VPTGLPVHCCVFAVATSSNEALLAAVQAAITNPGLHTFASLAPYVVPLNDVAQRNLHIQLITMPAPSPRLTPFWSLLAWLEISNPFREAASAHLVIDTTQSPKLADLVVEANDTIAAKVAIGEAVRVDLIDALQPGDHMILRLRANIPPDTLPGTLFPIDIGFYVGEQFISGYQHILRVAPLAETVAQVLDTLFGALWDVAAGFALDDAAEAAERVARIIEEDADWPEQALDSVSKLADRVAAIGMRIDPNLSPTHKIVRQQLLMLAGTLLTRPSGSSSSQLVEQLREQADRIQEPAGRRARALLI